MPTAKRFIVGLPAAIILFDGFATAAGAVEIPKPVIRPVIPAVTVPRPNVPVPRPAVTVVVPKPNVTVSVPKVDVPRPAAPRVDVPKAVVNVPKVDAPKPVVQAPKVDVPKAVVAAPRVDVPKPVADVPKIAGKPALVAPPKVVGPVVSPPAASGLPVAKNEAHPIKVIGPVVPTDLPPLGNPKNPASGLDAPRSVGPVVSPPIETTAKGGPPANGVVSVTPLPGNLKQSEPSAAKVGASVTSGAKVEMPAPANAASSGAVSAASPANAGVGGAASPASPTSLSNASVSGPVNASGASRPAPISSKQALGAPGSPNSAGPVAKASASASPGNGMTPAAATTSSAAMKVQSTAPAGTVSFGSGGNTPTCSPAPCQAGQTYRASNGAYAGADVVISGTGAVTPTAMTTTANGITATVTGAGSAQQTTTVTVNGQTYTVNGGGPTTLSGNINGQQVSETRANGVSTVSVGNTPVVTCGYSNCTVLVGPNAGTTAGMSVPGRAGLSGAAILGGAPAARGSAGFVPPKSADVFTNIHQNRNGTVTQTDTWTVGNQEFERTQTYVPRKEGGFVTLDSDGSKILTDNVTVKTYSDDTWSDPPKIQTFNNLGQGSAPSADSAQMADEGNASSGQSTQQASGNQKQDDFLCSGDCDANSPTSPDRLKDIGVSGSDETSPQVSASNGASNDANSNTDSAPRNQTLSEKATELKNKLVDLKNQAESKITPENLSDGWSDASSLRKDPVGFAKEKVSGAATEATTEAAAKTLMGPRPTNPEDQSVWDQGKEFVAKGIDGVKQNVTEGGQSLRNTAQQVKDFGKDLLKFDQQQLQKIDQSINNK
ncbi:hypothetical protein [Bradyrhizobium sp. BR 10289]|uniref:hypothetical protein n=1 Tax=Bradyrhizobium sp. BR 10289 TaxID=2749993 RepID=UPI001C6533C8|nr:hypothetical protein [Bradyrhizobium sp. BR 10289]MBW7971843.1 hypothetical protein [Bradyrhizobium sp. BR 10289]